MPCTEDLTWLVGHRLQSFTRREYDWVAEFGEDTKLTIACLWRLIEGGRIRFTSQDEGQWFGLSAPIDSAQELSSRVLGQSVEAVDLKAGTLDLEIRFGTGHLLQVIPDSSGYEAWKIHGDSKLAIAVGGGSLAIFDGG